MLCVSISAGGCGSFGTFVEPHLLELEHGHAAGQLHHQLV